MNEHKFLPVTLAGFKLQQYLIFYELLELCTTLLCKVISEHSCHMKSVE